MGKFFFYILKCRDGTLYSGATKDLKQREQLHNQGKGSAYVRARGGGKIVYHECFNTWGQALRREAQVKKLARITKLELIKKRKT